MHFGWDRHEGRGNAALPPLEARAVLPRRPTRADRTQERFSLMNTTRHDTHTQSYIISLSEDTYAYVAFHFYHRTSQNILSLSCQSRTLLRSCCDLIIAALPQTGKF